MKKNFMMIALASVLMMPVSCTKNELEAPQGPAAGELTFVAYAEGGDSKTTLNEEDGSVAWAIGDQIKFDYELEKVAGEAVLSSVLAEGDIVEGAATFTAALPEAFTMSTKEYDGESRHMYVTYPASIETDYSSASEFLVTVPAEQDGTFAKASIAHAKWDPANPKAPLQFYNLCGLLQIEIADDAARQIVLEASSDLVGNVSVTFTKEGYEGLPTVKAVKEGTKTITVDVKGAGVYYVAVLPGSIENLYVAINDAEGNLLGDRTANNAIPVARKQIRKLGTIGTGFSDRLYIKSGANGQGTSWTDAAGVDKLLATMQSTEVVTKNIYVAAGDYTITDKAAKPAAGSVIKIYGGYSASATGYSLAGRDVENNVSRIQSTSGRTFYTQKGNWVFDGLYFKSEGYKNKAFGCALLLLNGTESVLVNNCHFVGSIHGYVEDKTNGGGIVRVATTAKFTNCTFSGNRSEAQCGGIYVAAGGVLSAEHCEFFENTAVGNAGAISVNSTGVIHLSNCQFESNTSGINGGAIHFNAVTSTESTINNCSFVGNTAPTAELKDNGLGGAISSAGAPASIGTASFTNCLFNGNQAGYGGGAVWSRALNYRFTDCNFIDNDGSASSGGDAILMDNTKEISVYCNRCFFGYTKDVNKASLITDLNTNTSSSLCLANSVVTGDWGKAARLVRVTSNSVIVNSTLYGQQSSRLVQISGTCNVINSIVVNAASSGTKGEFDNSKTLNVDYSLYHMINTGSGAETSVENSLSGIKVQVEGTKNFPVNTTWFAGSAAAMYKANGTTQTKVNDCRGNIYYYAWDGSYPENMTFSPASLETVKGLVQTADSGFAAWLGDSLSKDIRGVSRNTAAMWPGSYEDATATAGLESLNVK